MSRLPHRTSAGWAYFVTTKAFQPANAFQVQGVASIVVGKLLEYRDKGNYLLHEFVVMPNHFHLLLTPGETTSLEKAVQLVKGGSSHEIHKRTENKMEIWQVGFHDWTIRDGEDYRSKVRYIQMNPVQAGLVERSGDWPYGSACGRFVLDPVPEKFKS